MTQDCDIWAYDVASGRSSRLTTDGVSELRVWDPTHVAYSSARSGHRGLGHLIRWERSTTPGGRLTSIHGHPTVGCSVFITMARVVLLNILMPSRIVIVQNWTKEIAPRAGAVTEDCDHNRKAAATVSRTLHISVGWRRRRQMLDVRQTHSLRTYFSTFHFELEVVPVRGFDPRFDG